MFVRESSLFTALPDVLAEARLAVPATAIVSHGAVGSFTLISIVLWGNILNDYFDATEYLDCPIPSERVSRPVACSLGIVFFVARIIRGATTTLSLASLSAWAVTVQCIDPVYIRRLRTRRPTRRQGRLAGPWVLPLSELT